MVFCITAEGTTYCGCALENYAWPDGKDWLPIEVRTVEGWFTIEDLETHKHVLVCPD